MNERIKELAEQNGFVHEWQSPGEQRDILKNLERFAELIVKECIGITDDLVNRNTDGTWITTELYTDYNGALFEVKRQIKEHFGVEE